MKGLFTNKVAGVVLAVTISLSLISYNSSNARADYGNARATPVPSSGSIVVPETKYTQVAWPVARLAIRVALWLLGGYDGNEGKSSGNMPVQDVKAMKMAALG